MENNELSLHEQKVVILGRLIKESSLTLEEALLLLKPEEQPVVETSPITPHWNPFRNPGQHVTSPWTSSGTGQIRFSTSGNVGLGTSNDLGALLTVKNTADAAL